jgi:hypothetical protein
MNELVCVRTVLSICKLLICQLTFAIYLRSFLSICLYAWKMECRTDDLLKIAFLCCKRPMS